MNTAGGGIGGVVAGGVTTAGGGGGGGTTCRSYYDLKVQWPGGATWLGVGSETYGEARSVDQAEVRLWQGDVVELRVRGHIHSDTPSSQQAVLPWLALGCLILAAGAWALLSGRLSGLFAFSSFGLLFVAAGVGWLGSMALFGGLPAVWVFALVWTGFAVSWTVAARRFPFEPAATGPRVDGPSRRGPGGGPGPPVLPYRADGPPLARRSGPPVSRRGARALRSLSPYDG